MLSKDLVFLQAFLTSHSKAILADISTYGAVLLRGFEVASDADFERTVLSIQGLKGISEAFMSEEGRIHAGHLHYVLHTNAVYKTGGTLYLGGFHSENYYSADVPGVICFYCAKPSQLGGETGLINMEKVYQQLDNDLKIQLEKNTFLVSHWLIRRYFVASLVGPAVLLLFSLAILPGTSATGKDYVILGYVVGMCFVPSLLSGLPFWVSRQTKQRELQKPITDATAQSSGDPIPPA